MDYIKKNLRRGEVVLCKAKVSALAYLSVILCSLILIGGGVTLFFLPQFGVALDIYEWLPLAVTIAGGVLIGIGALVLIIRICQLACFKLAITNKRLMGKKGFLSLNAVDVPLFNVDSVAIRAGLFGRMFRCYQLCISSVGNPCGYCFRAIKNANELKNRLIDALEWRGIETRRDQAAEIADAMTTDVSTKR